MARDYSNYSKDALIAHIYELEKQLKNSKYGLYWDKSIEQETVVRKCKNNIPVLKREEELCLVDGENNETNILIEGDNFHALTTMNMMCGNDGLADVIYIDPPYNTRNKEFVYNDNYVDKEDGFRHSKWISFMEKRLVLARNLMIDEGVIFISIDDHEQANLQLLCDRVFGNGNFIAMAIHKNNSNKNQSKLIGVSTEYVLIYAKNKMILTGGSKEKKDGWKIKKKGAADIMKKFKQLKSMGLSIEEIEIEIKEMYKRPKYSHLSRWNKVDDRGVFKDADLSRNNGAKNYTIINPDTGKECVIPERGWGKSETELLRLQKEGLIWYGDENTPPGVISYITGEDLSVPDNFWYFDNSTDVKMLKKMFGYNPFDNPKPIEMIKSLLEMSSGSDAIIIDFFAGSGTTGQAVLELNKEDGGHRKFILCTNNEGNICTDVTYPRLKTVITGKRQDGSEYSEGIPSNLMYYKTDFIKDSNNSDQAKYSLVEKVDELLCIVEETYACKERTEKYSHYQSFDGNRNTFIYSDYYSKEDFVQFLDTIERAEGEKVIYMFSTDNTIDGKLFEELENITLKPIPSKIYEIYKEIVEDIKRGEQ